LNLELFRREFQFLQPIIPRDDEAQESDDAEDLDQGPEDSVILINGGKIEAREIRESPSKPTGNTRIRIEETKMNFFDPSIYNNNKEYEMEKGEEDQILEGKIDPIEWMKEVDRVDQDLDNIERDVELAR
jgi:hypothetical protein